MDNLTPEKRAWVMSRVKSRDTKPEKVVRSMLHHWGYRFRLRRSDLPGCPDIVLPKYRSVIFVHGCYWHRHNCPNGRRLPRTRLDFWKPKLEGNRKRDLRHYKSLDNQGWKVLIIWECMLKDKPLLLKTIQGFLKPKGSP